MGKILEALATDHLCMASFEYKGSAEYREARSVSCRMEKRLFEKLSEEDKKLLSDFNDAQAEENLCYANHLFIKGFRLGVLMMMEVVTDQDSLILHEEYGEET